MPSKENRSQRKGGARPLFLVFCVRFAAMPRPPGAGGRTEGASRATRRYHLRHAARWVRRRAFLAFCALYVLAFSAAFASIANFGILARQRTLMLPAFLALLYVPISTRRTQRAPDPQPALTASR